MSVRGEAEATIPARTVPDMTALVPTPLRLRRATRLRLVRVLRRGWTLILQCCLRNAPAPLQAAYKQAKDDSGTREGLSQLVLRALHATNVGQLLKDTSFFFVRKAFLECVLFCTEALDLRRDAR